MWIAFLLHSILTKTLPVFLTLFLSYETPQPPPHNLLPNSTTSFIKVLPLFSVLYHHVCSGSDTLWFYSKQPSSNHSNPPLSNTFTPTTSNLIDDLGGGSFLLCLTFVTDTQNYPCTLFIYLYINVYESPSPDRIC